MIKARSVSVERPQDLILVETLVKVREKGSRIIYCCVGCASGHVGASSGLCPFRGKAVLATFERRPLQCTWRASQSLSLQDYSFLLSMP